MRFPLVLQLILSLKLAVCGFTLAGFGAFPKDCDCRSGLGPSMMSQKYKNNVLTVDSQTGEFDEDDVDFTTVKQLRVWQIETVTHIGGALPHWNMSVQFWMYHYVSQKFQLDNSDGLLYLSLEHTGMVYTWATILHF
ncbi:lysophospholipid acyltransferase 7-like [Dysidea avara]|uniref:lysophospholipid acyltransferase 7-like n=1 Tax=Dysidea avara TaxID=196820 RepID=UPI003333577D